MATMTYTGDIATLRWTFLNMCVERGVKLLAWNDEDRERFAIPPEAVNFIAEWNVPEDIIPTMQSMANILEQTITAEIQPEDTKWTVYHYAIGLHELGHCMRGKSETDAWEWAIENSPWWTDEMHAVMIGALLGGYYQFGTDEVLDSSKLETLLDRSDRMRKGE